MAFDYGLYPMSWHPPEGDRHGYHEPPAGSVCVLDWRPLSEQAAQRQSTGWGLFAWEVGVSPAPADLVALGSGDIRSMIASTAAKNELRIKMNLGANPAWSGALLADCVADVMGKFAVTDGSTGPKPIMPQSDGVEVIQLGGHSPVWSKVYSPGAVLAQNPTGRANRQRDVYRANMQTAFDAGGLPLLARALGALLLQHGYSRPEVAAGAPSRSQEWRRFLTPGLQSVVGGNFKPVLPGTSFSESWPGSGDIRSGGNDRAWTCHDGAGWDVYLNAVSGGVRCSSGGPGYWYNGRCTDAVSSANHWVDATIYQTVTYAIGPTTRHASGVESCYAYICKRHTSTLQLVKWVSGSVTALWSTSFAQDIVNELFRCRADGSTISGNRAGFNPASVTDTALTGTLTGGVIMAEAGTPAGNLQCKGWTIDDGIPSAPVAAFTGTPLTGTSPLSVAFTDASTNTPTSWLWEKSSNGGGSWANFDSGATSQNPTESLTAGTWAIRLTATNAGGSDSETKLAYIVVAEPPSGGRVAAGSYALDVWRGVGL